MQQIVLASRPTGAPVAKNFRLEGIPTPTAGDNEFPGFYSENVGGKTLMATVPLMNVHGRISLCGMIS